MSNNNNHRSTLNTPLTEQAFFDTYLTHGFTLDGQRLPTMAALHPPTFEPGPHHVRAYVRWLVHHGVVEGSGEVTGVETYNYGGGEFGPPAPSIEHFDPKRIIRWHQLV